MTDHLANADDTIITLEQRALALWCHGDPAGFLEICAPDVVYFDPFIEQRINGRAELGKYYEPLRGKIYATSFELLHPRVQLIDRAAVLTYNFKSRTVSGDELGWNCTEVYRYDLEGWRIVQSHWSLTNAAGG